MCSWRYLDKIYERYMEVTQDMIRRFHLGQCSAPELEAVRRWLENTEEDGFAGTATLPDPTRREMWNAIEKKTRRRPAYNAFRKWNAYHYVAAACLIVGLYMTGIRMHSITHPRSGMLMITAGSGQVISTGSESCVLDFDGYLQLINTSDQHKVVIYNGNTPRTFSLAPGQTYYLENVRGNAYLIEERLLSPNDNYLQFVRGTVSINCENA
jgi:hypothetical protein